MLDSFSYVKDYMPLRRISYNGENLGVLLFEGYMKVELSHALLLHYFVSHVDKKHEVKSQLLTYIAKAISLGLNDQISGDEILRGKGNKGKKKSLLPINISSHLAFRDRTKGDLKYFYEKLSDDPNRVGYTSASNIERVHRKEKQRVKRLLEVEVILNEIVDINFRSYENSKDFTRQPEPISEQTAKLKEIYKNPNKLW